ncbi:MAG: AMP-binding protein [Synergistaceae bacterium]|nr:AMP-binding protein [Synergistaceae bacterium]
MLITDLLKENAASRGQDIAIVEINPKAASDRSVSWREYEEGLSYPDSARRREMTWQYFDDQANRVANFCLSRGIGRGNKAAMLMMNALEWFPIYFGILRSGAMVVPMSFRNTADEAQSCLALTDADAIFFGPEFTGMIRDIHGDIPSLATRVLVGPDTGDADFALNYSRIGSFPCDDPGIDIAPEDAAAIYFTSGTMGKPKAILQTHESILSVCRTERKHHGQTRDDVFLCMAPLFHTGSMMHWLGSLISAGGAVLLREPKPESILKTVSEEGVTIAFMLVPWAQDVLQALENDTLSLSDYELGQWRLMHIGAQPVPVELISRWKKFFPSQQYDTNYGLSEAMGPGCVHLGVDNSHKIGAIGLPGEGWQARIVDDDGNPVPQGQIGELTVRGPSVMKCYYNDPEATEAALRDGWLFTGDMGYVDPDGFTFLVDRKKDIIISGGENIYPIQIEDHIRKLSQVLDVAVIGANHKRLGEVPIAIVSVKPGCDCDEEDIMAHCEDLPRYKRPRRCVFGDVPRNPTGKIEKPRLRATYADMLLSREPVAVK